MLQRYLIAMARIGQPGLIVLDEPTSALDPVLQEPPWILSTLAAGDPAEAIAMARCYLARSSTRSGHRQVSTSFFGVRSLPGPSGF